MPPVWAQPARVTDAQRPAAVSISKLCVTMVTSCAYAGANGELIGALRLQAALPGARFCRFGEMLQSPPFDGPVDRRHLAPESRA